LLKPQMCVCVCVRTKLTNVISWFQAFAFHFFVKNCFSKVLLYTFNLYRYTTEESDSDSESEDGDGGGHDRYEVGLYKLNPVEP
jgi:hypothetical protein